MIDVAALYRAHGAMVFRRAYTIVGDADLARDVVQEVFMRMHARRDELATTGLVSWLYTAATNQCLNLLRDRATRARLLADAGAPAEEARPPSVEVHAALREALATLDDELARVAVLRFVDEMTHAEIAALLGCSRRHVGDLLVRLDAAMTAARRAS